MINATKHSILTLSNIRSVLFWDLQGGSSPFFCIYDAEQVVLYRYKLFLYPSVRYYRGDSGTFDTFIGTLAFYGLGTTVHPVRRMSDCRLSTERLGIPNFIVYDVTLLKIVFQGWTVWFWTWRLSPWGTDRHEVGDVKC